MPRICTRLFLLFSPLRILTADIGTFKRSANSLRSASFARPSTGGASMLAFNRIAACPRRHAHRNHDPAARVGYFDH